MDADNLECPFCGYNKSDNKFGLGVHINRWCDKSPPDEDISEKLMSGDSHPRFGEKHSDETKEKMSEYAKSNNLQPPNLKGEDNPAKKEEVQEKISESMSGEDHWNWNGEIQDEDALIQGIKDAWNDGVYDDHIESISGEDAPCKREEVREKISEGVSKAIKERGEPFFNSRKDIETNGNELVSSSWEATVYNSLYDMNIEFEYEGFSIEYNNKLYFPDFIVKNKYIIEVKGPYLMNPDKVKNKAKAGVERSEDYIVIGNENIPYDYHIEYVEDSDIIKDQLSNIIK